jgi:hypothetical protein
LPFWPYPVLGAMSETNTASDARLTAATNAFLKAIIVLS